MLNFARVIAVSGLVLVASMNAFAGTTPHIDETSFESSLSPLSLGPIGEVRFDSLVIGGLYPIDGVVALTPAAPAGQPVAPDNVHAGAAPAVAAVPAPGLVLLGAVSTSFVGWVRRRRSL